jgi:hypothetical protein
MWEPGGRTTPTDPRSKRIRASRRGGQVQTRARGPQCDERPAQPAFAPGCPASRTVAPYSPSPKRSTAATARSLGAAASAAFHTGYKCHRSAQPAAAQGDQDQGPLPQRGRRAQADLPRRDQRGAGVDPNAQLDRRAARVQDPLRRPRPRRKLTPNTRQTLNPYFRVKTASAAYTDFGTLSR